MRTEKAYISSGKETTTAQRRFSLVAYVYRVVRLFSVRFSAGEYLYVVSVSAATACGCGGTRARKREDEGP
jgi:hypothetical protein